MRTPDLPIAPDDEFTRTVLRCCPDLGNSASPQRFIADIHPNDQMFTHSLREHGDRDFALSQYYNVALQQYAMLRQIAGRLFPGRAPLDVLDFACGYGRLLRFLRLWMPPESIWASELQTEAMDFAVNTFAVHGLPSCADPADFNPQRRFDLIWVASLFSHLPPELFRAWLAKLLSLLAPGGALCFSVHGDGLLAANAKLPPDGILYLPRSENPELGTDIYGTAYVSEAYVHRTLAEAGAVDGQCVRIPYALANDQDLYVVARSAGFDAEAIRGVKRGIWGWVDRLEFSAADGGLYLEGWAGSRDDGPAEYVEISVGDRTQRVVPDRARADVAAVFADARMERSGWIWRQALGGAGKVRIDVVARSADGGCGLLYAGTVAA